MTSPVFDQLYWVFLARPNGWLREVPPVGPFANRELAKEYVRANMPVGLKAYIVGTLVGYVEQVAK